MRLCGSLYKAALRNCLFMPSLFLPKLTFHYERATREVFVQIHYIIPAGNAVTVHSWWNGNPGTVTFLPDILGHTLRVTGQTSLLPNGYSSKDFFPHWGPGDTIGSRRSEEGFFFFLLLLIELSTISPSWKYTCIAWLNRTAPQIITWSLPAGAKGINDAI